MSELIQINALAPLQGTRKTSKVMLLFPPEWVPTAPYLALPSLTAVLREAGHHSHAARHQYRDVGSLLQHGVPDLGEGPVGACSSSHFKIRRRRGR